MTTLDTSAATIGTDTAISPLDSHFEDMLKRLKLTSKQKADAKTKYTNVAKLLHAEFHGATYDGSTKLLIGSYGKRTNIRPPEDVDLLFKIPEEVYIQYQESPGALLQRIRKLLGSHYTTTEKISAWGKIVLVQFSDGKHNIELLPGFDLEGVFMIPNTENGGSWESFDVRTEMDAIKQSDMETGITRKLIRIIKRWSKHTASVTIKSYQIEQYCVEFLTEYDLSGKPWATIIHDFFQWLKSVQSEDPTQIQTALSRAANALAYESREKFVDACDEWRKVFGNLTFPAYSADTAKAFSLTVAEPSEKEQYIEDLMPVRINPSYAVSIHSVIEGYGPRPHPFGAFIKGYRTVSQSKSIDFYADIQGLTDYTLKWKVRNFGSAARLNNDLRGEITDSTGNKHHESTRYQGTHYIECYVIKEGVCVARTLELVPIGGDS